MKTNFLIKISLIAVIVSLLFTLSCVKDKTPPDCTTPSRPVVKATVMTRHNLKTKMDSANPDSAIILSVSGVSNAKYYWSGPSGFSSQSTNPVISPVNVNNNGTYWVKALVGYCFSDSVGVNVGLKTDTTCSLGNNGADFPNGFSGPFTMYTKCSTGSNGGYTLEATNMDSSILVTLSFNQIPSKSGVYYLTNSVQPTNSQVFYQLTAIPGGNYYCTNGTAYVKVDNGKINVIVCEQPFANIGVFSANLTCN